MVTFNINLHEYIELLLQFNDGPDNRLRVVQG